MSIPYVKFFTSDWIAGCSAMDPFEELVYLKICLHNWDSGLPIAEAGLSRLMRGHEEGITGALAYLLESGKITKSEDGYASERAVESFNDANKRRDDAINAASKRWKTKGKKDNTPAVPPHNGSICQPEPEPEPEPEPSKDIYTDQTELIPSEPAKPKAKRRKKTPPTLLTDDWIAGPKFYEAGYKAGLDDDRINFEIERMRNWSIGNDEARANWLSVFKNWIARGKSNGSRNYNQSSNGGVDAPSSTNVKLTALRRAGLRRAGIESQDGGNEPPTIIRPRFGES